jgi:hypothetical protein
LDFPVSRWRAAVAMPKSYENRINEKLKDPLFVPQPEKLK